MCNVTITKVTCSVSAGYPSFVVDFTTPDGDTYYLQVTETDNSQVIAGTCAPLSIGGGGGTNSLTWTATGEMLSTKVYQIQVISDNPVAGSQKVPVLFTDPGDIISILGEQELTVFWTSLPAGGTQPTSYTVELEVSGGHQQSATTTNPERITMAVESSLQGGSDPKVRVTPNSDVGATVVGPTSPWETPKRSAQVLWVASALDQKIGERRSAGSHYELLGRARGAMKLPRLTAARGLDAPAGWYRGRAPAPQPWVALRCQPGGMTQPDGPSGPELARALGALGLGANLSRQPEDA